MLGDLSAQPFKWGGGAGDGQRFVQLSEKCSGCSGPTIRVPILPNSINTTRRMHFSSFCSPLASSRPRPNCSLAFSDHSCSGSCFVDIFCSILEANSISSKISAEVGALF